jgi:hypothetical protein
VRLAELNFHLMRLACLWTNKNPFVAATADEKQSFNRHVGSTEWWNAITTQGGRVPVAAFVDKWETRALAFQERSRAIWLYPHEKPPGAVVPIEEAPPASADER